MRAAIDARLDRWFADRPIVAKLVRYSSASVAGTVTTQVGLVIFVVLLDWDAVPSNLCATTIGAVPNYLINRAWTWNKSDPHSFSREVLPFWVMTLLGLALSTVLVALAADRWPDSFLVVALANVSGFGLLWVAKYLVLEKVLFKQPA